jgi:hypothetical protein
MMTEQKKENKIKYGTCPVCNGTGTIPACDYARKNGWYGYDKDTDTKWCTNCGSRGMYSRKPNGLVQLRKDNGEPCVHNYISETIGRCYYKYTCEHCDAAYTIDSGD